MKLWTKCSKCWGWRSNPLLINLRGTNGSGKTTVVRSLVERLKGRPIYGSLGSRLPEAYQIGSDRFVLGPYLPSLATSGCDAITNYDKFMQLLEAYAARGSVVFEGLIVSGTWGRCGELLAKNSSHVLVLTTPLTECIRRVEARRIKKGLPGKLDPKNIISMFERVVVAEKKFISRNVPVQRVSSEDALGAILKLLEAA